MKLIKTFSIALTLSLGLMLAAPSKAQADDKGLTIVETALAVNADSGQFSTLIAAVVAADLVDVLNGNRQFTVFAPTDEAFAALNLNADNIGDLPPDMLTNILLYHVSPGHRLAEDVLGSTQVRMLNKQFTSVNEGPLLNESGFVATDVECSNGVIHIIDAVLIPAE